ncbi:MAG: hypothetical protein HUK25_08370 [Treponema sp.]|nr:hypothetical protein [Treponema sp.]
MTIKSRNRLLFILFITSAVFFVLSLIFFIIGVLKFNFLAYEPNPEHGLFRQLFFDYHPFSVYNSIFFMNVYVVVASFVVSQAFEKTQSSELVFYFCFLVACLAECARLYIPFLVASKPFTGFIVFFGRFSTFARILAPLALLFSTIMTGPEQRQNLERNLLLIIVISIFAAFILPLNTGVLEKTFRIHVGFDRIVVIIEILVHSSAVISLFISNIQNGYKQWTTLGLALIIAGFVLGINGINLFVFNLAAICTSAGTFLYLNSLHNRHLYE